MTDSRSKDVLLLALAGLFIGSLIGILASGAYAEWARGGDLANVGFGTIFNFLPVSWRVLSEPFRTAAMIGGGIALAMTMLVPVIGMQPVLTSHGSARWATGEEIKRAKLLSGIQKINGPIFGKLGTPKSRAAYLTSVSIPHSLITAPTGVGKGVGIVTPTLLTYPGSIICLDLKGANYENTARHRHTLGDRVFRFSPYDAEGRTHRFNPLEDVAATDVRRQFTEARRLAASFITIKGDSAQGFLDGARDIFAATALLVIERGTPTIAAIHDALSQPGKASTNLFNMAVEVRSDNARSIFNKFSSRDDKHLSAYLSILMDGGLGLWADPMVRDATAATDFRLGSLRSQPASIYIVIPPNDIEPLAPLVRLIFQQAVAILQRTLPDPKTGDKYPVLMLLDEFVSLGRMDNLKTAITTLREYQVRVMLVVQTISSLRDLYGKDGAGTFISNCGIQLFMGPADEETPDYISKAIGDFTRKTRSRSWKGGELTTSYSERMESARLIRPEQVRLLGVDQVVALVQNMLPIIAHRVTFFEDRELKRIFGSQKGDYPEPPNVDPYDPSNPSIDPGDTDPRPSDGPLTDGSAAAAIEDAREAGDMPAYQDPRVEDVGIQPEKAAFASPASPASPASEEPGAPSVDVAEADRERRIKGLRQASIHVDALSTRVKEARRKLAGVEDGVSPSQIADTSNSKAKRERKQPVASEDVPHDGPKPSSGSRAADTLARLEKARADASALAGHAP